MQRNHILQLKRQRTKGAAILEKVGNCVSRQREAAMSPSHHHTFLIDYDSGVCICLTGAPGPVSLDPTASPLTPAPHSSRRLLQTRLTSCMKTPGTDHSQDNGALRIMDKREKTPSKTAEWRGLADALKGWIRRLGGGHCCGVHVFGQLALVGEGVHDGPICGQLKRKVRTPTNSPEIVISKGLWKAVKMPYIQDSLGVTYFLSVHLDLIVGRGDNDVFWGEISDIHLKLCDSFCLVVVAIFLAMN
ncbi:unnamed protein product [Ranitomeya imitator]|uniref:Uncharacterized protein n=1 Tax=Ranitomeya imitator TaxID=111125 RepID=A0ABN9L9A6_9NEOB|nr:unnamed protein product [Ranitomeya imitator]